jgi:hypothetical protein
MAALRGTPAAYSGCEFWAVKKSRAGAGLRLGHEQGRELARRGRCIWPSCALLQFEELLDDAFLVLAQPDQLVGVGDDLRQTLRAGLPAFNFVPEVPVGPEQRFDLVEYLGVLFFQVGLGVIHSESIPFITWYGPSEFAETGVMLHSCPPPSRSSGWR